MDYEQLIIEFNGQRNVTHILLYLSDNTECRFTLLGALSRYIYRQSLIYKLLLEIEITCKLLTYKKMVKIKFSTIFLYIK